MLSVLVCSISANLLSQFRQNIEQTIGADYEIIVYDNSISNFGLCKVYNILASKANGSILCFVHEDVVFSTINWGNQLEQIFRENTDVGVVGVAGSKYKSANFSGWYTGLQDFDCASLTHEYPQYSETIYLSPNNNSVIEEVVCLDGVFICCRKKIWEQLKFDESNLIGFHLYDIDFTLRAARICTVVVSYQIKLTHITKGGDFGNTWVNTSIEFHTRNKNNLPYSKHFEGKQEYEIQIAQNTLDALKSYPISFKNKMRWITLQNLYAYPRLYYSILKFLVYSPFKLKHIHKLLKTK